MKLYSIKDERSVYAAPFVAHSDEEAERQFQVLVRDVNTMPGMFPKDFSLWLLGCFDEHSGLIQETAASIPLLVCRGSDFGGDE